MRRASKPAPEFPLDSHSPRRNVTLTPQVSDKVDNLPGVNRGAVSAKSKAAQSSTSPDLREDSNAHDPDRMKEVFPWKRHYSTTLTRSGRLA